MTTVTPGPRNLLPFYHYALLVHSARADFTDALYYPRLCLWLFAPSRASLPSASNRVPLSPNTSPCAYSPPFDYLFSPHPHPRLTEPNYTHGRFYKLCNYDSIETNLGKHLDSQLTYIVVVRIMKTLDTFGYLTQKLREITQKWVKIPLLNYYTLINFSEINTKKYTHKVLTFKNYTNPPIHIFSSILFFNVIDWK